MYRRYMMIMRENATANRRSLIYIAPSGVQKERLVPRDLFTLDEDGAIVSDAPNKAEKKLSLSQCTPLFMNAYLGMPIYACDTTVRIMNCRSP